MLQKTLLYYIALCYIRVYWGHFDDTVHCTGTIQMITKTVMGSLGCHNILYYGH